MRTFKQVVCRLDTIVVAVALFSAFVWGPADSAAASPITYNFVDYPCLQTDYSTGIGTWTLSGTIQTDGTLGPITSLDQLRLFGSSLTLTGPDGTYAQTPHVSGWGRSGEHSSSQPQPIWRL